MTRLTLPGGNEYTNGMAEVIMPFWTRRPRQVASPGIGGRGAGTCAGVGGPGHCAVGWGNAAGLGYPPRRYDLALSTERLNHITEYVPADLTVTAQAGVTLAQLQETLAAHGQFLPLDVALPERQTLGGIIAARADSLRRLAWGSVRDSLLGVTVINDRGERIKGGGKVVKNVAGYDLPKLYCGSLGTLGLIAEATFKVAPAGSVCDGPAAIRRPT